MMYIAGRMKIVRGELSQGEFAKALGVHKNSLGRYERGDSIPGVDVAERICSVFGVNPYWLLLGEGPMKMEDDLTSTTSLDCFNKMKELEKRVVELEAENTKLREEAMCLYRDALSAYKRLYEAVRTGSTDPKELISALADAAESAPPIPHPDG